MGDMGLTIQGVSSDDEDEVPANQRDSFMLSQSGTFNLADFKMNKSGMSERSAPTPQPAPGGHQTVIDVATIEELELMEDLGAGASGTVKKAKHKPSGVLLAVKQIQILEKAKRDQMVAELRIMRTHDCPWLVTLYNAFYEDAAVSMVLEYMDHGSLADVVAKHPKGLTDERKLAMMTAQMLNGLNYLHRQHHQVHRDLKPANVLMNSRGQVKISDFGISSQLDSTNGMCSTFVGTTCYMAPERLSGGKYSYGADIWSLGLIVLELMLGKYPYPSVDNYFKLLSNIMDKEPPGVPEGVFSDELAEFVHICLDKNSNRPGASDLLKHPWLRKHPSDDMLLSASLEKMSL